MNGDTSMQSKFMRGLLFAWVPVLFLVVPVSITIVKQASSQKAMGLGVVAGGLSVPLTTFGLLAIVCCELYGAILLLEGLSKEQPFRALLALVSIGCGLLFVIGLGTLVVWLMRGTPAY
jgi:hypothetical protein